MKKMLSLILVFASLWALGQDKAQWRGPNRDGIYNETGLLKTWPADGPKLLWHYDNLGSGHGSAAIYGSTIYTTGTEDKNGFVIAFDNDGKVLWKTVYGEEWFENWDGVRVTPMIDDGRVYIMSGHGLVVCFDATSGQMLWKVDLLKDYDGRNIQWGMTENLLSYDDYLVCTPGGIDANVIALNKNTGKLIWKCKGVGEKSAYCSPALVNYNNRRIIVTHTAGHIIGVDADKGTLLWSVEQPNKYSVHANTPIYSGDQIFCVSGYGQGGVMLKLSPDGNSVTELWRDLNMDSRIGGMVLVNGKIYGSGDASKKWVCLDWKTGKELYENSEIKSGNIIAADGLLYWYSENGKVYLVEPAADKFEIKGSFEVPYGEKQHWAHLVINNKRLFVRHGTSLMVYSIAQ